MQSGGALLAIVISSSSPRPGYLCQSSGIGFY